MLSEMCVCERVGSFAQAVHCCAPASNLTWRKYQVLGLNSSLHQDDIAELVMKELLVGDVYGSSPYLVESRPRAVVQRATHN